MKCPTCETENPPQAEYCTSCGVALGAAAHGAQPVVYCTSCGRENPGGATFCTNCGAGILSHSGPTARVETSQVATDVEYMGFWIRVGAAIIDMLILGALGAILAAITSGQSGKVQWFINILYYVLFTGLRGQTPGKMLVGIQVVTSNGEAPGIARAALREVLGKFISTIVILLGYIWVAFDPEKRAWHDKLAGTYVIKKR